MSNYWTLKLHDFIKLMFYLPTAEARTPLSPPLHLPSMNGTYFLNSPRIIFYLLIEHDIMLKKIQMDASLSVI